MFLRTFLKASPAPFWDRQLNPRNSWSSGVYGTPIVWNLPHQPFTQKVFINKCIQINTNIRRHFTSDGSGQGILYVADWLIWWVYDYHGIPRLKAENRALNPLDPRPVKLSDVSTTSIWLPMLVSLRLRSLPQNWAATSGKYRHQ